MLDSSNAPIDLNEQISWMKRYVSFRRTERIKRFLNYVGYFRASRYGKFLLSYSEKLGKKPTHNMLFELYKLDEELRKVFFNYCQCVEIRLKTVICDTISLELKDELFYLNELVYTSSQSEKDAKKRYRNKKRFPNFIRKIGDAESEIRTNINKYPELIDYRKGGIRNDQKLPCWVYFYYIEFGNVCMIFDYLNLKYKKKILDNMYNGKTHSKHDVQEFSTWIDAIKNLRNICCHHNILFGKTSSLVLQNSKDNVLITNTDLFSRIYAFKKVLSVTEAEELKNDLRKVLNHSKLDWSIVELFPEDWETRFDNISSL